MLHRIRIPEVRAISRLLCAVTIAAIALAAWVSPASAHALYEKSQPASGGQLQDAGPDPGLVHRGGRAAVQPARSPRHRPQARRPRTTATSARVAQRRWSSRCPSSPTAPTWWPGGRSRRWTATSRAACSRWWWGRRPRSLDDRGAGLRADAARTCWRAGSAMSRRWPCSAGSCSTSSSRGVRLQPRRPPTSTALDQARLRRVGLVACAASCSGDAARDGLSGGERSRRLAVWQALGEPTARLLGTRLGPALGASVAWACSLRGAGVLSGARTAATGRRCLGAPCCSPISLSSHAAAITGGAWLAVLVDWLHQVAAAAWVGGLFAFVLLRDRLRGRRRTSMSCCLSSRRWCPRFSALAIVSRRRAGCHRPVPDVAPGQGPAGPRDALRAARWSSSCC